MMLSSALLALAAGFIAGPDAFGASAGLIGAAFIVRAIFRLARNVAHANCA